MYTHRVLCGMWAALLLLGMAACSPVQPGGVAFEALTPDGYTFDTAAHEATFQSAALRPQASDPEIRLTGIRVAALQGGRLVQEARFEATAREAMLDGLEAGTYEVVVEAYQDAVPLLRAKKAGVRVEPATVAEAGEFLLAPILPKAPDLLSFPSSVTTRAELRLEGMKEMFTGIRVRRPGAGTDAAVLPVDDRKNFAVTLTLEAGDNEFHIAAVNPEGTAGETAIVKVQLTGEAARFTSIVLANAAADGYINAAERASSRPIVGNLVAYGYVSVGYAVIKAAATCDLATDYGESVPSGDSAKLSPDGLYKVCVRLTNAGGEFTYGSSAVFEVDTLEPRSQSVSVVGSPSLVTDTAVTLSLAAAGAHEMQVWEGAQAPSSWESFNTAKAWLLSGGDGEKIIHAQFRDRAGNVSAAETSVVLDTTPPTLSAGVLAGGAANVTSSTVSLFLESGGDAWEMQVTGDTVPADSGWIAWQSSSSVELTPESGMKTVWVRVRDEAGNTSTSTSDSVQLDAPSPVLDSLSIASGSFGDAVVLSGSHFGGAQGESRVFFGGVTATVVAWADSSISVEVPGVEAGDYVVSVKVGGVSSDTLGFAVHPTISGLSVASGIGGDVVTVSGAGLSAVGVISLGGAEISISDGSLSEVSFSLPATAPPGIHDLGVIINGKPSGLTSFTVRPALGSLDPPSGVEYDLITLSGTNFGAEWGTVWFDATPATVYGWSATSVEVQVPSGLSAGVYDVVLQAGGESTEPLAFSVEVAIDSISVSLVTGGESLQIYGGGFGGSRGSSAVYFDGVSAAVASWSSSYIDVFVPDDVAAGETSITVDIEGNVSEPFPVSVFPSILSTSPASGAPGATFIVQGTNFADVQSGSSITLNAQSTPVVSWSMTSLEVEVPDMAAGVYQLVVTVGGFASGETFFTVEPGIPAQLALVSPAVTLQAGQCSSAFTVELRSSWGDVATTETPVEVTVGADSGTMEAYADASCTTPAEPITIETGTSSTTFYISDITAGEHAVSAVGSGFSDSVTQVITPAPAAELVFSVAPDSTDTGAPIAEFAVSVFDPYGNPVSDYASPIALAIATNPAGGTLSGTVSVVPVSGVATFGDVSIDMPGLGYQLSAASGALTSALSPAFDIRSTSAPAMLTVVEPSVATTALSTWHWVRGTGFTNGTANVAVVTSYNTVVDAVTTTTLSDQLLKFHAPTGVLAGAHRIVVDFGPGSESNTLPFTYTGPAAPILSNRNFTVETMGAQKFVGFEQDGIRYLFICTNAAYDNRLFQVNGSQFVDVSSRLPSPSTFDCLDAAVLDVDGDGRRDLVMTAYVNDQNRLWLQDASGNFIDATATALPVQTDHSWGVVAADFNGDGLDDFFVTNDASTGGQATTRQSRVFLNQGNGSFAVGTVPTEALDIGRPAVGDFDGDGYPDLVLPNGGGQSMFWRNQGDGSFVDDTATFMPTETDAHTSARAADFFNNGLLDVVLTVSNGQTVIYRNEGTSFSVVGTGFLPADSADTWDAAVGDLDGDGWTDIVLANGFSAGEGNVVWYNQGDGTFVEEALPGGAQTTIGMLSYDFDGDGDLDVLVANDESTPLVFENQTSAYTQWEDLTLAQTGTPAALEEGASAYRVSPAGVPGLVAFGGTACGAEACNDLHQLRLDTFAWTALCTEEPCLGSRPTARSRTAGVHVPSLDEMLVFGDHEAADGQVYHYSFGGDIWSAPSASGDGPPTGITAPTMTRAPHWPALQAYPSAPTGLSEAVLVAGGEAPSVAGSLGLWAYDPITATWYDHYLEADANCGVNPCPVVRHGHAAAYGEGRLFVFGGEIGGGQVGAGDWQNDIWAIGAADPGQTGNPVEWQQLYANNTDAQAWEVSVPSPRSGAALHYYAPRRWLIVHGDTFETPENSLWAFDLATGTWLRPSASSDCALLLPTCTGAQFSVFDPSSWSYIWWGGTTVGGVPSDQLWRFGLR